MVFNVVYLEKESRMTSQTIYGVEGQKEQKEKRETKSLCDDCDHLPGEFYLYRSLQI